MTKTQVPASTLQAILFGSRACGTAHVESDADVAIIWSGPTGHFVHTKMALNDIADDILQRTGIRIQSMPVWVAEWAFPYHSGNRHLLHNIACEGVTL